MLQIIEDIPTDLNIEMRDFLTAFQLKHATVSTMFNVRFDKLNSEPNYYSIGFFDSRFEDEQRLVGKVKWWKGNRNSMEYIVSSRLIENAKFSHWSRDDRHSQRTKDLKKALKLALQHFKDFSWNELTNEGKEEALHEHKKWVRETSSAGNIFRISSTAFASELENLMSQGVVFITEEFKKAIAGLPTFYEQERRENTPVNFDSVYLFKDKVILSNTTVLNSIEELPERHRHGIALLRLTGNANYYIPEVGYKQGNDKFYIYS
jgi:hypothetical protein